MGPSAQNLAVERNYRTVPVESLNVLKRPSRRFMRFRHLLRYFSEVKKKKDSSEWNQQMRLVRFLYEYCSRPPMTRKPTPAEQ
jgi:hypothetical protein